MSKRDADFQFMPEVMKCKQEIDVIAARRPRLRSSICAPPPAASCTSIFTVGFCFGGSNSWNQAAMGHGLSGAIGFYGSTGERNGAPGPVQRAAEFEAPILALQAGADEHILPEHNAAFEAALEAAGVEHELVVYEGPPHSFFDRRNEEYAEASADAWDRVLAFIAGHAPAGRPTQHDLGSRAGLETPDHRHREQRADEDRGENECEHDREDHDSDPTPP